MPQSQSLLHALPWVESDSAAGEMCSMCKAVASATSFVDSHASSIQRYHIELADVIERPCFVKIRLRCEQSGWHFWLNHFWLNRKI
eukprot:6202152-Pleurochrysis_carterae.AAC.2